MRVSCCDCGVSFGDDEVGSSREVVGWVSKRKRGGSNAVHDPRGTGKHRCQSCSKLRQLGVIEGQMELTL